MASKKRQQTIGKRNRERAVAEKRALKLQRKQEKREAARNGEVEAVDQPTEGSDQSEAASNGEAEAVDQPTAAVEPPTDTV